MKLELFIALRYLKARRKQAVVSVITVISVLGVAAGVSALIIALSLNTGFQEEFQGRILGATSHVNVVGLGGRPVSRYREVLEELIDLPEVDSAEATVYGECLLQSGGRQEPAMLKGIESSPLTDLRKLIPQIVEGNIDDLTADEPVPPIVLGKDLANSLVVSVGEYVRALGLQGELSPLGRMPRVQTFRVVAIFESGLWDFDANWALTGLPSAQRFLGLHEEQVSALEFRITDIYEAPEVAARMRKQLGETYSTNTWIQLNKPLFSALKLEKLAMFIAIGLIVLVASLNIVSTLTLMVMEKNRDIAILNAMGGTAGLLTRIFILQGVIIGTLGTVIGDVLGLLAVWYLDTYKVFQLTPEVYSIPYVPFRATVPDLILVSSAAIVISFVATLYPARAASQLDPVEALRYE